MTRKNHTEETVTMTPDNERKLFPFFLFEIAVVALFTLEAVLLLAVLFPSPVGREIDFSAPYQPRPEWYFLFLYQLTKYFPGKATFVGAVLLPGLAFSVLLLAPFLDKGPETDIRRRPGAAAVGITLLCSIALLTALSLL
jgi:quinol-cytochrome oxidoreductase complex cytochrome b subunit